MNKRRNCFSGAIIPLFNNSFNIYIFCKGVKLHLNFGALGCYILFSQFLKSDMSKYGYLDVFLESPLEFKITRADCILEGCLIDCFNFFNFWF